MKFSLQPLRGGITSWLLARPSAQPINQASLRLFSSILIFAFFLLGLFSFFQWRIFERLHQSSLSREYILRREAGLAQEMSTLSCNAHRATLSVLLANDREELEQAISDRVLNLKRYIEVEKALNEAVPNGDHQRQRVAQTREDYDLVSGQLVKMVVQGKREDALAFRLASVRPAFDLWQKEQGFLIQKHDLASQKAQDEFRAWAGTVLTFYLSVLLIPLVVIVFTLVLAAVSIGSTLQKSSQEDSWSRS